MNSPNPFAALAERIENIEQCAPWIAYFALFGAVVVFWVAGKSIIAAVLLTLLLSWLIGYLIAGALFVLWVILRLFDGITRLMVRPLA
ncbi:MULTISPECIES: hypothetical protein [unclassified Methylococcus]|uniref:hypothetical protein n=1 Tax=unclassified Methylococcus TaxID=2618889 RepID=UPI003D7DC79C